MTEIITNPYYDGPEQLRVVIERDYEAGSPRLNGGNLFFIETWDQVEGTPDFHTASEMSRKINWSFTGPDYSLAGNWRGSHHSYTRLDPKLATIIARWLVAFEGHAWARPLTRTIDGRLQMAVNTATETVGVIYTRHDISLPSDRFAWEANIELEQYNDWARGDVWRYWLEEHIECPCEGKHPGCDGGIWEELPEAECEIYGKAIATDMAMEHLAGIYGRRALA